MNKLDILLIEDGADDAALAQALLRKDGRFETVRFSTLVAALQCLVGSRVDLVIVDLNLPDSTGLDTFRRLREACEGIPVVILSGRDDEEIALEAVALGAQDYVAKSELEFGGRALIRAVLYGIERHRSLSSCAELAAVQRDLDLASAIQEHLLPSQTPDIPGLDIAGACLAADACSGDFFDYIVREKDEVDVLVADVSGHGFGPALTMVGVRRTLRTCAALTENLSEIIRTANNAVYEDTFDDQFVTLFYARIDAASRQFRYIGAGHPGWVVRRSGEIEELRSMGLPLGFDRCAPWADPRTVELRSGDTLLMMTDGVWETMAPNGQLFGRETAFRTIRENPEAESQELLELILDETRKFAAGRRQRDDVTAVLVRAAA